MCVLRFGSFFCQKTLGTKSKWSFYGGVHPQELIIYMGS